MEVANKTGANEQIFTILMNEDELTWQNIIYDLIAKNEMDPWDINVSLLAEKFLEMLQTLKEMDFRISGKIVLAAALLLKIKSNKLIQEDILALDNMISGAEEEEPLDLLEEFDDEFKGNKTLPKIHPRTPQPRKRKVSIYDLVDALEKALETEEKRKRFLVAAPKVEPPKKSRDISLVIKDVYEDIKTHFSKDTNTDLTFDELVPSESKEDKIFTFIPLLHLENQRKVDMDQEEHFGQINISLLNNAS